MSFLSSHRTVVEGLLDGLGLHRVPPDRTADTHDTAGLERAYEVRFGAPRPLGASRPNHLHGYALRVYPLTVRVAYLVTGRGGDEVERQGEQDGSGTLDDVEDRAELDRHRILDAVGRQTPFAACSPAVLDCRPVDGAQPDPLTGESVTVYESALELWVRVALPGSYQPSL